MPGARFVAEALPGAGESWRLPAGDAAHARARRLPEGAPAVLVDGSGREALGRIVRAGRGGFEVLVDAVRVAAEDGLPPIHLLVAAVRAERLAWVAEKATELGAARLTLVLTERTQSFRGRDALVPRLSRVVQEAVKQSESARWPQVDGPQDFHAALEAETAPHRILLDAEAELFPPVLEALPSALLIGPEGGWAEKELRHALSSGWIAASLCAGKLRAETAAVAALTLARHALARGALTPPRAG